jgi:phage gpG-like protein
MPEIIGRLEGSEAVVNYLRLYMRRAGNPSPVMKAIGERVVRQTFERFNAGGPAPDGTPWAPVKRPHPRARGILRVTDQLRDSNRYQILGPAALAVGTNKVYGAIHQFGGKTSPHTILPYRKKALFWPGALHPVKSVRHPGSAIPARPYLGISQKDSDEIISMIGEYIEGR